MATMVYTVACGICPWGSSVPTQAEADAAAERHEHENDGHLAYVLAPDRQRHAA